MIKSKILLLLLMQSSTNAFFEVSRSSPANIAKQTRPPNGSCKSGETDAIISI